MHFHIPNPQICIIDDDLIYRLAITKYLKQKEWVQGITEYANGEEAIKAIQERIDKPDIILLDLNMPVMDGWEFIEAFKNLPKHVNKPMNIYILTSSLMKKDFEKYQDANIALDYLTKPMNYSDLIVLLDSLFEDIEGDYVI